VREVAVEELLAFGQIDLADRFAGRIHEVFGDAIAADLLQVAILELQTPPREGHFRQSFPVPFGF
jgi:hypothetical protein